jgi:hypothetical protein
MGRKKNLLGTRQIRFSGNRLIEAYLADLTGTGLYGRTPSETAERLVSQGIQRAISDGTIERRELAKFDEKP